MKNILLLSILFAVVLYGCRGSRNFTRTESDFIPPPAAMPDTGKQQAGFDYHDQSTWILGYFNVQRLTQPPHSEWFLLGKNGYDFNSEVVNKLKSLIGEDITIKIVMGTWCPDSRREVPRFMKIMETVNFPEDRIQFIGVDDSKFSPIENFEALNIQRVPTFIIYRNKIESGRIIENPATSLEQDMVNILTRNEE